MCINSYNITRVIGEVTGNFSNKINEVNSSNNKIAEILGVSFVGLYENNNDFSNIYVYVLDENISEENKEKLQYIAANYNRSPKNWLLCPNLINLLNFITDKRFLSLFSRTFFIHSIIKEINKVLYKTFEYAIKRQNVLYWITAFLLKKMDTKSSA